MRVICVDDATVILQHTLKLLEGLPQIDEVKGFTNPLEALDFVKENPVDLALLDIEMPEMNGIQPWTRFSAPGIRKFPSSTA